MMKMIFWRCGFSATKSQTALIRESCTTNPDKQNVLKGDNQPDNDKKTHFTPNPTTGNSGPSCCWWLFDSNNNLNNNNNLLNNPKAAANVDIYSSGGKTSIAHYVQTCERETCQSNSLTSSIWTPPFHRPYALFQKDWFARP